MILKSTSALKTKKIAAAILTTAVKDRRQNRNKALIIGLTGELGSGKTMFVKGIAKGLGIKSPITSPTFLLIRKYPVKREGEYSSLFHIDAYRTIGVSEFKKIGIEQILKDPKSIVVIEWAEKIKNLLPKGTRWVIFRHSKEKNERIIETQRI